MATKTERYFEGVGRRKTAVARVRLMRGEGGTKVNDKSVEAYFPTSRLRNMVTSPVMKLSEKGIGISARVQGGGIHAQAEAVRHGIARALVKMNPEYKMQLRTLGYLTRDPRMVERKKYGLKKARRAPQWAKR